jgi:CubicO group peptidase (beta-lactamase class C family)
MLLSADPAGLAGVHLAPLASRGVVPSLAWAVVRGRDAPAGGDVPVDWDVALGGARGAGPRTIFQIGSVTKVFTALLLADMAERGEVRLSDPAARYLPGRPAETGHLPGLPARTRASSQASRRPNARRAAEPYPLTTPDVRPRM